MKAAEMTDSTMDFKPRSYEEHQVASFLEGTADFRDALSPVLSIVAVKGDEAHSVISARLAFVSSTALIEEKSFASKSIKAVRKIVASDSEAIDLILRFLQTGVEIDGERYLIPFPDGHAAAHYDAFHQGLGEQSRFAVLSIRGLPTTSFYNLQAVDWELRGSSPPYLNLQELLADFQVSAPPNHAIFEAFCLLPVAIDTGSVIHEGRATVRIRAEPRLKIEDVSLGLVAWKIGEPAFRAQFQGSGITWDTTGSPFTGLVECEVPIGRSVQAIACYKGVALTYWWLIDPNTTLNPRKGVFEVADPGLGELRNLLQHVPKGASRNLEFAVSWLFWILGFSPAHLGSFPPYQDFVDILVLTPSGKFAVVECTTGVIADDSKVANLLRRRSLVKDKLTSSGHLGSSVLPVLITSCSKQEVQESIASIERRGVLVVTRDDLLDMINRSDTWSDADAFYSEAEQRLAAAITDEGLNAH